MFVRMVPFNIGYWIMSFFIPVYNKEIVACRRRDMYVDKMLRNARQNISDGIQNTDLASILLRVKNDDGSAAYSQSELRSNLYTFIFAGFETTAHAMKWCLFFIGQHPAMANRIAEEFEKNGSQINAKTLKNVPFTSFFIKEVLSLVFKLIAREILPNDRFVLFTMQFRHFHFENLSQNYSYNRLSTIS